MKRSERIGLVVVGLVTVLAGVTRYVTGFGHVTAFVVAGVALAGVAWIVSFATEQVGERFGAAATGMMQSTLGNLPEFFVVIFALNAGEKVVAETAILGSILVNALFVLGLVIVVGALRSEDNVMRFNARLPNDTATMLLIASFIILLGGARQRCQRLCEPPHQDDLDHRRGCHPRLLRGVGAPIPHARSRAARAHRASRACP